MCCELEMRRVPADVEIVKDGPHVRLFAQFSPFSRCLGEYVASSSDAC
jgi:hypothetical protein